MVSLADPIELGPARIRNRVFVAPHTTNFGRADENLVTERHIDYHRERARGGAGLIITEGIRVHPTSLRRLGVHAYDDDALPGLTALAETVHAEGAALFAQILHTGRHSGDDHYGSFGPAPVPWSTGAHVPHEMNVHDLREVVTAFADAARRVVAAGFDGMEVHLGHGHLLHQFLSPVTNTRTDAYGGSAENRLRFARECVAAVRDAVAGCAAVGVRLSADEFLPGGIGIDDTVGIVRALLADGPLDFVHVSHSAYIGTASLATQMADMSWGTAPFRHLPARIATEFPDVPVLAICRIDDLETGQAILDAGGASMVGFARAHIADPALSQRPEGPARPPLPLVAPRHRRCIACNQGCNANLEAIVPITCTVNPAVGRERAWSAVARTTPAARSVVVVVGAGPAGLEAAITAAGRGHRVHLIEQRDRVGGGIRSIVLAAERERFGLLLEDLSDELAVSRVELRTDVSATAPGILALRPDEVVLATGSRPDPATRLTLAGIPVLESVAVLADHTLAGRRCVVVDETGTWEASSVVTHLRSHGVDVELVSPTAAYAARITVYSRLALAERLTDGHVGVHTLSRIVPVGPATVEIVPTVGTAAPVRVDGVAAVVHVRPRRADDRLLADLDTEGFRGRVHLVGDAFAPRTAQEAVYEGRAVGMLIGIDEDAPWRSLRARSPYLLGGSAASRGAAGVTA